MDRRQFVTRFGLGAVGAALALPGCDRANQRMKAKPNILFILADDLGWAQIGAYGSRYYETPNIDRLAAQGMRFTDAYAACPVCSPTRASIMTGQYPARLHLTDFIAGADYPYARYQQPPWQKYLPLEEVTMAEILKRAGYKTASFGKWHLSITKRPPGSEPFNPDQQGFDESIVTYKPTPQHDPEQDAHNVAVITASSLKFMEDHQDRPFFLYVAHNTVHRPLMEQERLVSKYRAKPGVELPQNNPVLGAMIERLDDSVGQLLRKLEELEIAGNTVVIFMSDNGGLKQDADQTPLREGKATLYEGGIREPLIIRWPGVVQPGSTSREPVSSIDFFPTITELAGLQTAAPIDGLSLVPLLKGGSDFSRDAIYWHYPHYHSAGIAPSGAVRKGDYKLIEWYDERVAGGQGRFELYNLKEDIGEKNNLVPERPEKTAELRDMLAAWRRAVGAQMPTLNPDYDPDRADEPG